MCTLPTKRLKKKRLLFARSLLKPSKVCVCLIFDGLPMQIIAHAHSLALLLGGEVDLFGERAGESVLVEYAEKNGGHGRGGFAADDPAASRGSFSLPEEGFPASVCLHGAFTFLLSLACKRSCGLARRSTYVFPAQVRAVLVRCEGGHEDGAPALARLSQDVKWLRILLGIFDEKAGDIPSATRVAALYARICFGIYLPRRIMCLLREAWAS